MKKEEIKKNVREAYAEIAKKESSCCAQSGVLAESISKAIGYTKEEIEAVPEGSNLGLGCGNPTALASIKEGETVLDLGSGAGFDCFLAAQKVGKDGKVIGVDMTPEMIEKARENAENGSFKNVEFRLGEIENLPVADQSVDLVISNCVINLSPDKKRVFQETFRVLKPNGRIMISDLVLLKQLPDFIKNSIKAYVECIGGAILKEEYLAAIKEAGFQDVKIVDETSYPADLIDFNSSTAKAILKDLKISVEQAKEMIDEFVKVASVKVYAIKPARLFTQRGDSVSLEENKALIRRYMEEVLKGDLDAIDEIFATNCIDHTAPPGTPKGVKGIKQLLKVTQAAFSNIQVTVKDLIAEDDKVVSIFTIRGIHTGNFVGIAPTNTEITVMQISIDRVSGGKIVEHWGFADQLSLMQQLSVGSSIR